MPCSRTQHSDTGEARTRGHIVMDTAYVVMRKPSDKDLLLVHACSVLSLITYDVTYVDTFHMSCIQTVIVQDKR